MKSYHPYNKIIASLICFCCTVSTYSQQDSTLTRTVVVENQYNPTLLNANKIGLTPSLEQPRIVPKQIQYADSFQPNTSFVFEPIGNIANNPYKQPEQQGYARLGYGNNGNIDARLGYCFYPGEKDRINTLFAFRGMNATLEYPESMSQSEWDSRIYRTQLAADWQHLFKSFKLDVAAEGESQTYNYNTTWTSLNEDRTRQTNLLASLQATLANRENEATIQFKAGTGILYANQKHALGTSKKFTEKDIRTHASITGVIDEESRISLQAQMDNFLYSSEWIEANNYTSLQFNPAYHLNKENWNVRLGAHLDFQTDRGAKVQLSPDMYGEYRFSNAHRLYAQATGGRILNDFRTINQQYPYDYPGIITFPDYVVSHLVSPMNNGYIPVDVQLGFRTTPMNEMSLHVYGGFRTAKDEIFSVRNLPLYPNSYPHELFQDDANALYAGVTAQYRWKNMFATHIDFLWDNWNSDVTDNYLTMHPELTLKGTIESEPIKRLRLALSYLYEQRKASKDAGREKAINNLGIAVSYELFPTINLWAKGDNLLNQDYFLHTLYPAQGINFLLGASVEF